MLLWWLTTLSVFVWCFEACISSSRNAFRLFFSFNWMDKLCSSSCVLGFNTLSEELTDAFIRSLSLHSADCLLSSTNAFQWSILAFAFCAVRLLTRKPAPKPRSESVSPLFSSSDFTYFLGRCSVFEYRMRDRSQVQAAHRNPAFPPSPMKGYHFSNVFLKVLSRFSWLYTLISKLFFLKWELQRISST